MSEPEYIESANRIRIPPDYFPGPPRKPAETDPEYIKHVACDGARFHVLSYSGYQDMLGRIHSRTRCSEPRCIINKPPEPETERK